jgi:CheY-like chemotaxis protein
MIRLEEPLPGAVRQANGWNFCVRDNGIGVDFRYKDQVADNEYRIMIAEDNAADVYLIEEALRRHEFAYHLEVADNGEDMLKIIARIDQDPSEICPDLFLLDLNLPRRSGDEVLARIRHSSRCAHVPVIVITSSDSPQDRARTRELGASFYFRKPADLEKFMAIGGIVREFLETRPGGVPQASLC